MQAGIDGRRLERMVRDARENETEDLKFRELADARNNADSQIHETRRTIDAGEIELSDADKHSVRAAIETLEVAIQGDAKTAIDQGMSALGKIMDKLSKPTSEASSSDKQANSERPADEDVVDTVFEDLTQ